MDRLSPSEPSIDDELRAAVEEYANLKRRGTHPTIDAFVARHPDISTRLRGMLSVLDRFGESLAGDEERLPPVPVPETSEIPRHIGGYRLIRKVGQGGMGIVYEAIEESLGRRVALKILPGCAPLDERRLERFQREAQAAAALHHANIVPVFGLHEHDGQYFYTMQFIEGLSLDQLVLQLREACGLADDVDPHRRSIDDLVFAARLEGDTKAPDSGSGCALVARALSQGRAGSSSGSRTKPSDSPSSRLGPVGWQRFVAEVGVQVASALEHAHRHGILHRDIKPSNLILDQHGTVWVTDFGLAKLEGSGDLTDTGEVVGTYRFMPPERFEGSADRRGDVYSLGLTLYELTTLEPAFDHSNRRRLIESIVEERPVPPRRIAPDISRDLENIVLRAIEKRPKDRYQSADELETDLFCFLHGRPVQARPVGALELGWRWCRRKPVMASLLTLIALLLLTIAVGSSIATTRLRTQLRETHLSDARAARWSARPGRRWRSLESITHAAAIAPGRDLRDEVVATAHLTDLRPIGRPLETTFPIRKAWVSRGLDRAAVLAADGSVRVHSLRDGAELLRVDDFPASPNVTFPSLSSDGQVLAISTFNRLALWSVERREQLFEWRVAVNGGRVYPHPDRRVFTYCSGDELVFTDSETGDHRRVDLSDRAPPQEKREPRQVSWSPGKRRVTVAYALGETVLVLDADSGETVHAIAEHGVRWVVWHPSEPYLAVASDLHPRSRVAIWHAEHARRLNWIDGPEVTIDRVSFLGDWHVVADTWSGHGFVWDFRTGLLSIRHLAQRTFVADDRRRVALWQGKSINLSEFEPSVASFSLRDVTRAKYEWAAPHPRLPLVVASSAGLVFDTRTGSPLGRLPLAGTSFGSFNSTGTQFVTLEPDVGVRVRGVTTRQEDQRINVQFEPPRLVSSASCIRAVLSPDGRTLYAENTKSLFRVDLETGDATPLLHSRGRVTRPAVSPDGRWVATGSGGNSRIVEILDVESAKIAKLEVNDGRHFPSFSPDGLQLIVNTPTRYHFFQVGTWRLIRTIECESSNGIGSAALTDDGCMLAYKDGRNSVRLVDVASGVELTRLEVPNGVSVSTLSFSSNGDVLVAYPNLWNLRHIRQQLRSMQLDWEPPMAPQPIEVNAAITVLAEESHPATIRVESKGSPSRE